MTAYIEIEVSDIRIGDQVRFPEYFIAPMLEGRWVTVTTIQTNYILCSIPTLRPEDPLTIKIPTVRISDARRIVEEEPEIIDAGEYEGEW